jgi:phosphoribosylanthranilate isomerase
MLETAPKVNSFPFESASLRRMPAPCGAHAGALRGASFVIIQIYEIQTPLEAEAVIALGVDHIGSVVLSPRTCQNSRLRETVAAVQRNGACSSIIPLFRDPTCVYRMLDYYRPNVVHFCEAWDHAAEPARTCEPLIRLQLGVKERFPEVRIMRSIPIAPPARGDSVPTLMLARLFEPVSDLFLTDTLLVDPDGSSRPRQPVDGFVGVTGLTCDWQTASRLVAASALPVILAGGLSPENVAEGIRRVRPAGVDSCTLTNATDADGHPVRFKKDRSKVERFVQAAREAEKNMD